MNGLNYLIQTNIYLILFMGFYVLVLKKETFFRQNRIYLNASVLLSFLIPFINTAWFSDLFITEKVREATMPVQMMYDVIVVTAAERDTVTLSDVLFWIYAGVAAILFARLTIQLISLKKHLSNKTGAAFSFFNNLVLDERLSNSTTIKEHELVHIKEWHSADIILTELAAIIAWFNPVVYLYKREIRHIHEFIADEKASSHMSSKNEYAKLLFSTSLGVEPHELSNNFFNHSLLKRRIMMLHKSKSNRTAIWKYGFSAPLFAGMLIFSAATASQEGSRIAEEAQRIIEPVNNVLENTGSRNVLENLDAVIQQVKSTEYSDTTNEAKRSALNQVLIESAPREASDIEGLKKHLQRTIKYPQIAREQKTTGLVLSKFTIKDHKIHAVSAEASSNLLAAEVLRAIRSYSTEIDLADGAYTLSFVFQLAGTEPGFVDQVNPGNNPNHKGTIVIVGYASPVQSSNTQRAGDVKDFASVEVLPEFPGGQKGWGEYLKSNLKYPDLAKQNNIQGRVIVSFVVEKDGHLSDIKVLRGIGGGADEEAVRILNEAPKWMPGLQNGEKVRVAYTMPIFFQLSEPEEKKQEN